MDAVTDEPAFVRNGRMDLLAANRLVRAFYADVYADPQRPANLARFAFLDPSARRFYPDWDSTAYICVAILRTEAGRDPHDKDLQNLVGELSTRNEEFRKRWGAHNVPVVVPLRALQHWDDTTHAWRTEPGTFHLHVGPSSGDLPLYTAIEVPGS